MMGRALPAWFPFFALLCTAGSALLWYLFPALGPWPLALGLLPWLLRLALSGRPVLFTGFELPLLLFLATAGASVWAAYDRETAWAKFWLIVGAVLLFYAFAEVVRGPRSGVSGAEIAAWLLAALGALVATYFVATHDWDALPAKVAAFERVGRALQALLLPIPGHRLNPNVAGGLQAFAVPFQLSLVAGEWPRDKVRRSPLPAPWALLLALLLLALALGGLLLSTSRGAWLGLAAALAVACLWLLPGWVVRRLPKRRHLLLGVLAGLLAVAIAGVWLRPQLTLFALDRLPGGDVRGRLTLYRNGLALAHDYPFVGAGLGGFMMVYSSYQLLIHVGFSVHAHNLFLNLAIEQGLFALFALLAAWALFGLAVWRTLRAPASDHSALPAERRLLFAAGVALLTILLHGLVDDDFYGSRAVILLFVPLAFAVMAWQEERAVIARRAALAIGGSFLLLALLVGLPAPSRAAWYANLGTIAQGRTELAVYQWPEWPVQDERRRRSDMGKTVGYYQQALALNPRNFSANRRLGQIELSLGAYEEALVHLEIAHDERPWDNATRQLLGEALIANGQIAAGRTLWDTVNNAQDQLALREFWYRYIGDERRQQAIQRVLAP